MAESSAGGADWASGLRYSKYNRLASVIDHPKIETIRYLKALDLPRYRVAKSRTAARDEPRLPTADEFLANPEPYVAQLGTTQVFVALEHRLTGRRQRTWGISYEESIGYVATTLTDRNPADYNVFLREYHHPNTHIGQMIVERDFTLVASLRAKGPDGQETGPWRQMLRTLGDRTHSRSYDCDSTERAILDEATTRVSLHVLGLGEFVVTDNGVAYTDFFPGHF